MLALWVMLVACGGQQPVAGEVDAAAASVLQKADAHDGTEDQVVSECGGCGLGMAGSAEHAVKHGDYTLHFCSGHCAQTFEKDPKAGVDRLAKAVE